MTLAGDRDLAQALADGFQPGSLKVSSLYRGVYGRDASCYDYRPEAVVRASSVEDVQRVFAAARRHHAPVTFRAAGTSLCGQTLGEGIVVDQRLAWKRLQVRDGGETVWLEPGVILADVNHILEPSGRKLGPDPESAPSAMMGGVLANNSGGQQSGVERDSYATMRSLAFVLSNGHHYDTARPDDRLRFADQEPTVVEGLLALRERVRADSPLVERIRRKHLIKNVMGYDLRAFLDAEEPIDILARLLIGSEGTLAFISSAVLGTVPLHPFWIAGLLFFSSVTDAIAGVRALADDGASTVELMDRSCLRAWSGKPGTPAYVDGLPPDAAAVIVEYRAASAAELEQCMASAQRLISTFNLAFEEPLTTNPSIREQWFGLRAAMYPLAAATRPPGTSVVVEDVAVPADGLASLVLGLRGLFSRHGYGDTGFIYGHLSAGNVHFITLDDFQRPEGVDRFGRFVDDLVDLVLSLDGSLKAEHGTGRSMAPFLAREWGDEAVAVMRQVKTLLDPDGLLNPGVLLNNDPRCHLAHFKHNPTVGDDLVDRCVECGFCERLCPSRALTLTPRQRIAANRIAAEPNEADARAIEVWDEYAYEGRDTCVADGLCSTVCPAEINVAYLTDHLRSESHRVALDGLMDMAAWRFAVIENLLRRGIDLGVAIDDRLCGEAMSWVTTATRHLVPDLPRWSRSITKAPARLHSEPINPEVVYFPACVSRIMGSSALGKDSLMATVLRVANRAGISVRLPADVSGLCCGQIWAHKGFPQGQATMANRLVTALWHWTDGGRLPVLCDVTSCARTMLTELEREQFGGCGQILTDANLKRYAQLRIMDLVQWLYDDVLARLQVRGRKNSVLIHPTCACTELGLSDKFFAVASACAAQVTVPYSLGCCGAGGDRGFIYPELADAATWEEAREVSSNTYDGAYSLAKTCEIVLTDRLSLPFESLVYLVDEATA